MTTKKAVLITGGLKRLGQQFTRKVLQMGYAAVVHYRSDDIKSRELIQSYTTDDNVFFLKYDLSDTPEKLIDLATELPATLTGLVNNASVFTDGNLTDPGHFEKTLQINAIVPARLGAQFYKKIGKGWIINVTDAYIRKINSHFQNYRISKLLLEELTRQQAFLFAPGIRVNTIAPGAMIPSRHEDASYFDSLSTKIPLRKTADLHSLMETFAFLVNTPYITGEIIRVDGGWSLTE